VKEMDRGKKGKGREKGEQRRQGEGSG